VLPGVSREMIFKNITFWHFNSRFVLKNLFQIYIFQIIEKKQRTKSQQLFDGIIDLTLFDGVEGLDYYV
jgi:hypothetical protein